MNKNTFVSRIVEKMSKKVLTKRIVSLLPDNAPDNAKRRARIVSEASNNFRRLILCGFSNLSPLKIRTGLYFIGGTSTASQNKMSRGQCLSSCKQM